jgi:hypothetical protein
MLVLLPELGYNDDTALFVSGCCVLFWRFFAASALPNN